MLWAASLTTFFSFCRSGKLQWKMNPSTIPTLTCHSVIWQQTVRYPLRWSPCRNIKCSKTDQGRVGCQVVLGRTGDDLCPSCHSTYLVRRGSEPGASFVSVARWDPTVQDKVCGGSQTSLNSSSSPSSRLYRP